MARRIAAQAHGDLLVLERTINEKTGKLRQDIQVDDVRRTVTFFGSTAGEGGWRVAIVDSVDELNREGANALLKMLEEPPRRAVLLLISHSPARVLPTIRSRCRLLALRPLPAADVARAAAAAIGEDPDAADIRAAAAAADGSVRRALALLDGDALDLRNRIIALLERLPAVDPRALHALGDRLSGTDPATLAAFVDTVNAWLSARLDTSGPEFRAAGPRGRGLGKGQLRRARRRDLQSRTQAFGFQCVRLACRGVARLIPKSLDSRAWHRASGFHDLRHSP